MWRRAVAVAASRSATAGRPLCLEWRARPAFWVPREGLGEYRRARSSIGFLGAFKTVRPMITRRLNPRIPPLTARPHRGVLSATL
ncbi:hypothetical protein C8Q72DRAFT_6066 [Fomitopsis betulina]|nr:hypothetical protein C8Q72DRAFT_6066 [Fomitopsis betulina]